MAEASEASSKQAEAGTLDTNEFAALLKKEFKPQSDRAREEVENAVLTLAQQALASTPVVSDDAVESIQAIIAEIDRKLSEQINQIIHHADYQGLEGAWRGLHHLVNNTETDSQLKIR